MARVIRAGGAKMLDLPGRKSMEIVSGALGAASSLRLVEIPVPAPGAAPRAPHWHPDCEECIHVLSGEGVTWVDGVEHPMQAGDTIWIPAMEKHVTRNTGTGPLTLLCFFPAPEVRIETAGGG